MGVGNSTISSTSTGSSMIASYPEGDATTVQNGERTLAQIAKRLGVPEEDLRAVNPNIDPRNLQIGQDIIIPMESTPAESSSEIQSESAPETDRKAASSKIAEFNLGGQVQEMNLRNKVASSANGNKATSVDEAYTRFTTSNVEADVAAQVWGSMEPSARKQLVNKMMEKNPAAAAELGKQLGQASDPQHANEFWKNTETWMKETVADDGYHSRLPNARTFMDEIATFKGADGKAAKLRASRVVSNIQHSDEFGKLSDRAGRSGTAESSRAKAQLHMDTWKSDMRSGEDVSMQALARRDPDSFVRHLNTSTGNKKEYDAAINAALNQPPVDYTGRGERKGQTTDKYMENLYGAIKEHGSAEVKADFVLRDHKGDSLRPGAKDREAQRRNLMADPKVISELLHNKAEGFSASLKEMIKNDPASAQKIIGAGVSGYTLAYQKAMAKEPADMKGAKRAAYDLGLLLGETKEAAKTAFTKSPQEGYNFLEGIFKTTSGQLMSLIPGGNIAAEVGKDILGEVVGHFTGELTKFPEDMSGKNTEEALDKFVSKMFAATRDSFWTLRDTGKLRENVRQSPELDAIEEEYKQFNEWLDSGYAAGRDSENNASRTR